MCRRAQIPCRRRVREDAVRRKSYAAAEEHHKPDMNDALPESTGISSDRTTYRETDTDSKAHQSRVRRHSYAGPEDKTSNESWKLRGESLLASTTSSMRFAERILDDNLWAPNNRTPTGPPGHGNDHLHVLVGDYRNTDTTTWTLQTLSRPPQPVMEVLIDIYLLRAHWFILLLHPPSFKNHFVHLWRQPSWQRKDAGAVLVILLVAALGAQCAVKDPSRTRNQLMQYHAIDLLELPGQLASEVKLHLLDVMSDCSVESVQIALLLARYLASTGSPGMSWTLVGMAARNAYAGGLHHPPEGNEEPIRYEIRRRTWIATKVIDTFSAFFHGRPPSLDCNFTCMMDPWHALDLELPRPLADHAALQHGGFKVDLYSFHRLKFELYEIMAKALAAFRQIRSNKSSARRHEAILHTIRNTEAQLHDWRLRRPPFFDYSSWENDDVLGIKSQDADRQLDAARILTLQSITIQVILDSNVLMLHRPVLELGLSLGSDAPPPFDSRIMLQSLQMTLEAALRISAVPLGMFEKEVPLAYILMASLTAAVILCLAPIASPMSVQAHQAKEGLLRIIHSCKALAGKSGLAEHMSELLPSLMTKVVRHETHAALSVNPTWDSRAAVPNTVRRPVASHDFAHDSGAGSQNSAAALYPPRHQSLSSYDEAQLVGANATTAYLSDDWAFRSHGAEQQNTDRSHAAAEALEFSETWYTDPMRQLLEMLPPDGFNGWS